MSKKSAEFKRRFVISIVVLMFLSLAPQSSFAAGVSDISDHWAKNKIQSWLDKGAINGYPDGTFQPDSTISRAEYMSLVNNVFGFSTEAPINFSDVSTDAWYAPAVAKAMAAGYISGYSDGTIRPDNPISREEAAAIIMKITNLQANEAGIGKLADAADINWSKAYVGAVATASIMSGYSDGSFQPQALISRSEAVVAIDRAKSFVVNNSVAQTMTGFIIDEHCFVKKPVPGADTKVCLQMPTCAATGYGIAVLQQDGSYKFYYLDGAFAPSADGAQAQAAKLISATTKTDHINISVTGKMNGNFKTAADGASYPVITVSAMAETSEQTLSGYIIDEHCYLKKPVAGADTKMCLQMPTCAATGYGIAVPQNDGSSKFYYFDGDFAPAATAAQTTAASLINNTTKKDHVFVSVTGLLSGDTRTAPDGFTYPVLKVAQMSESTEQTLTGFIIDKHCFVKKPVPELDTKVCLQMPTCAASGYGIATLQNDGSYKFYYFDGSFAPNATDTQALAATIVNATANKDHIAITVTGIINGDTITSADGLSFLVIKAAKMSESVPSVEVK